MRFRVNKKCSDTHVFKYSKDKDEEGGVAVQPDVRETPIQATYLQDINALLEDSYRVADDRLPSPKNRPNASVAR